MLGLKLTTPPIELTEQPKDCEKRTYKSLQQAITDGALVGTRNKTTSFIEHASQLEQVLEGDTAPIIEMSIQLRSQDGALVAPPGQPESSEDSPSNYLRAGQVQACHSCQVKKHLLIPKGWMTPT